MDKVADKERTMVNLSFSQAIEHWHDFYLLAGSASATLIGLLFIAASLHPELFSEETASRARLAATEALTNFFVVLAMALVFLVPDQSPQTGGIALIILALIGLLRFGSIAAQQLRGHTPFGQGSLLIYYFALPLGYNFSMLYVAARLWSGNADGMGWLVWVIISILIQATAVAWIMLTQISTFRRDAARRASGLHVGSHP